MYGPKWPFLLMYGSHDMRHIGFLRVDGLSTDPRDLGLHMSEELCWEIVQQFTSERPMNCFGELPTNSPQRIVQRIFIRRVAHK